MKRLTVLLMSIAMLFCITPIVSTTINPDNSSNVVYAATQLRTPKVTVTSTTNKVALSWNKVKNAKKYYVYRATSKNGSYTKIATTTTTKYSDKKVKLNKGYYYKIKAGGNGTYKTSKYSVAKYVKPKFKGSISLEWLDYNFDTTTLDVGDTATLEVTMSSIKPTDRLIASHDDYINVEWIDTDNPDVWKLKIEVLEFPDNYNYTDWTIDISFEGYEKYYVASVDYSISALKDTFPTYNIREDVIDIGQCYGIKPGYTAADGLDENSIMVSRAYSQEDFLGSGHTVREAEELLNEYLPLFGWELQEKSNVVSDNGGVAVRTYYVKSNGDDLAIFVDPEYTYILIIFCIEK